MGAILWLYQMQELFIVYAPDTYVTENSHGNCSWITGHRKIQKTNTLDFNLSPLSFYFLSYFSN